ncbi:hypothetical protein [Cetobacterium sp.]|uniref:hypothetical protein n=1 Tax=Cetobacterium sp. TaxID=2071632 RepID=UPI003F2B8054
MKPVKDFDETKEKRTIYIEPKVLDKIDIGIENLKEKEGEKITRSAFIRRAITSFLRKLGVE